MKKISGLLLVGAVVAATLTASVVASSAASGSGSSGDADDVLRFDTMFPVVAPFTGATDPVHVVPGAGAPWSIDGAQGRLRATETLTSGWRDSSWSAVARTQQPIQAIVTCDTVINGAVTTINVSTGHFPADTAGNSRIRETIALPDPCLSPTVFVGPVGGVPRWFAVTGR